MPSIHYNITLKEGQLTCSSGKQISNYIQTLGYIPGSALRGAFVNILINNKNKLFKDYYEFFMSSNVVFCNAYPIQDSYKCFPVPLSYFTCKDNPGIVTEKCNTLRHPVYNYSVKEASECQCDAELKQVKPGFVYEKDEKYYSHNDSKLISPGNKISDEFQNAGTGEGQFFFTETKTKGNVFYSFIHFLRPEAEKSFNELFKDVFTGDYEVLLGKRKNAVVTFLEIDSSAEKDCFSCDNNIHNDLEELFVYCFSDLILTDEFLDYKSKIDESSPSIFIRACKHIKNIDLVFEDAYVRNGIITGFNNALGFPLIQDKIIEKGSVIKFLIEGEPHNVSQFKEHITIYGLGLRRNEGFGRVLINPLFLTKGVYNDED